MSIDLDDPEIRNLLWLLQKHQVRYLLIGGAAVAFFGVERSTQDMDFWLAPTDANKIAFSQVLLEIGYTVEELSDFLETDFTLPTTFRVYFKQGPADFLTYVHRQLDYFDAEKHMVKHDTGEGVMLCVVPLNYLREIKIRAHRDKDLFDVSRLDKIHGKQPPPPVKKDESSSES